MTQIDEVDRYAKKRAKIRAIDIAIIFQGVLCGIAFFTHSIWLALPIIILLIFTYSQKSKTKEDEERRELLSNQAFAFGLLIPVFVIMAFFVWLVIKLFPVIIQNWK